MATLSTLSDLANNVLAEIEVHPESTSMNIVTHFPPDTDGMARLFVALYEEGYIDGFPITVPERRYPLTWQSLVLTDKGRSAIA